MKKVLLVFAVLVGVSSTLRAQTALPVHVMCAKGRDIYKPICNHVKQAVRKSRLFKPAKNGSRYVIVLYAETGNLSGGGIDMSVTYGAILSDPLSQQFPYHIATLPIVFGPSDSSFLGEVLVNTVLPIAVSVFSDVVDEINSYGALQRYPDEETFDDISEKLKMEIDQALKENEN